MIGRRHALGALIVAPLLSGMMKGERSERMRTELQAWTQQAIAQFKIPGAITAVRLADGHILAAADGYADVESGVRMTTDHRLLGASIGKTFVAALCLRLQRQGLLRLDEPVSRWLGGEPWFSRLPNGPALTLRMLLNHSSGLHDFVDEPEYAAMRIGSLRTDRVPSHAEKISLILDMPPLFAAGQGYAYSDTNYILVGLCIEKATGRKYYDLLKGTFLRPLRLVRTAASDSRRLADLAVGYSEPQGRYERMGLPRRLIEEGALVYNPATEWTGGGIVTNPQDLVEWIAALFDGRALRQKEAAEFGLTAQLRQAAAPYYYGQGMYVVSSPGGQMLGHVGSMPGYSGLVAWMPWLRTAIAMQANITTYDRLQAQLKLAELVRSWMERGANG